MASFLGLPPGTSRSDINKMADQVVFPVPSPGYNENSFPSELLWVPDAEGVEIPLLLIQYNGAKRVIIYSHANAEDIGIMYPVLKRYAVMFEAHIVAYEYSGYGLAPREPSEANINGDMRTAFAFVTETLGVPSDRVFFFGRSLGSGPSTWMASELCKRKQPVGGLVLMSAFKSISSLVKQHAGMAASWVVSNKWKNDSVIKHVTCPLLIIHGADDDLIPTDHAKTLLKTAKTPEDQKSLNICAGADHNRFDEEYDVIVPIASWLPPCDPLPPLQQFSAFVRNGGDARAAPPQVETLDTWSDDDPVEQVLRAEAMDHSAALHQLTAMGFPEDVALAALLQCGGSVERAADQLLQGT